MTGKQKLILLAFAIADIAVILLLGSVVINSLPVPAPMLSPAQVQASLCEERAANLFLRSDASSIAVVASQVAWSQDQLILALTADYPTEVPPAESAQVLWDVLDNIASLFDEACPVPQTVTLAVTARGTEATVRHLAQINGRDMEAWRLGSLSDDALAAQSHYRRITSDATR